MCALTEGSLRISVAAKDGELKFLNRRLGGLGGGGHDGCDPLPIEGGAYFAPP